MNANHTDKGPYIYYLYTAEGTTELDSECVEASIKAHNDKQSTLRRRSVTLTDADQDYLEKLGGETSAAEFASQWKCSAGLGASWTI